MIMTKELTIVYTLDNLLKLEDASEAIRSMSREQLIEIGEQLSPESDRVSKLSLGDLRYHVEREVRETRMFQQIISD